MSPTSLPYVQRPAPILPGSNRFFHRPRTMRPFAILSVALAGLAHIVAADGGFLRSCDPTSVRIMPYLQQGGTVTLEAICRTSGGQPNRSVLDLNQCLVNSNGRIGCWAGGGAFGSCTPENSITFSSPAGLDAKVSVLCKTSGGGSLRSDISADFLSKNWRYLYFQRECDVNSSTDSCVGNQNGNLHC